MTLNIDGNATILNNLTVTGEPAISENNSTSGSVYGGQTLTINGNGFNANTTITIGSILCRVISYKVNELKCIIDETSSPYPEGNYSVSFCFKDNCFVDPDFNYSFESNKSPNIISISPTEGEPGDNLSIFGSNFGDIAEDLKVCFNFLKI